MDQSKLSIQQNIDTIQEKLLVLSHNIHSHPEIAFQEFKAVQWMTELLAEHNFQIEKNLGGIETAFKAVLPGKKTGPTVAFIAEYDALRNIGHGCGHNLIATAAVGAAISLSKEMKNLAGQLVLLGTPAEEWGGGKIRLLDKGVFDDIDFALMFHPASYNMIGRGGLAAGGLIVEFQGKSAHSAAPEEGINALQAVINTFNGIDSIRSEFREQMKVSGIITEGGSASNIIPDRAKAEFLLRARTIAHLNELLVKIKKVIQSSEITTGAKASIEEDFKYAERYPNLEMAEQFKKNMENLGEKMGYPDPHEILGSSDIGNVSLKLPIIHAYMKICNQSVKGHSKEFSLAAVSPRADEVVIKTAKALAMTGYDIFTNEILRKRIYQEFKEKVAVTA
ncbi:MAG: M20 family metallopeptidase [Spirochaetes bacterium]|nr:M20 family metallopeptidase [Spirochaetota bacterium]